MRLSGSQGWSVRGVRIAAAALTVVVAVTSAWATGCASSLGPAAGPVATSTPASDDRVAIYDLVVRRDCSDYFRDGKLPKVLYIVRREAAIVDGMPAQSPDGTTIPAEVQDGLLRTLADFGPDVRWTDDAEDVRGNMALGGAVDGGQGAIVELGRIAYSGATRATVYASVYVGNLGAAGRTYALERIGGVWTITGTTGVEWMS